MFKHFAGKEAVWLAAMQWLVDKLDQCVEVEVSQGFIDELVLEANMPGKRSPTAYKAIMMLSHRGGKLTD